MSLESCTGVPRCKECNRLYKKTEANQYDLCPTCLAKRNSINDGGGAFMEENQKKVEYDNLVVENEPANKMRPGKLIRDKFNELIRDAVITDDVLLILTTKDRTMEAFGVRYAFLKEHISDISIKELTHVGKHARYSSKPIEINGKKYLMTNDLYEKTVPYFMKWVEKIQMREQ